MDEAKKQKILKRLRELFPERLDSEIDWNKNELKEEIRQKTKEVYEDCMWQSIMENIE